MLARKRRLHKLLEVLDRRLVTQERPFHQAASRRAWLQVRSQCRELRRSACFDEYRPFPGSPERPADPSGATDIGQVQ
jgi:hypothetical protein